MLNILVITSDFILGMLAFLVKFAAYLCGLALALIIFLILFLVLVEFCVWIDGFLFEIRLGARGLKAYKITAYCDGVKKSKIIVAADKEEAEKMGYEIFDADSIYVSEVEDNE